jgi:hypothetical protein
MGPPCLPNLPAGFLESETVPHTCSERDISTFQLGLGLWCEKYRVSRPQYRGLKQLFSLLGPNELLDDLPESIDTLQTHVSQSFPLLPMKKRATPLQACKLASVATRVGVAAAQTQSPSAIITEDLSFFDPIAVFSAFLSSPNIRNKMFTGLGEFQDPGLITELWHSHAWTSSIRTTSGQCARYQAPGKDYDGYPILPSKFIKYQCHDSVCICKMPGNLHTGRVTDVGRDQRSVRDHDGPLGCIALRIQRVETASHVQRDCSVSLNPAPDSREYILLEADELFVLESAVEPFLVAQPALNYHFKSSVQLPSDNVIDTGPFIRRIFNKNAVSIRPLCQAILFELSWRFKSWANSS